MVDVFQELTESNQTIIVITTHNPSILEMMGQIYSLLIVGLMVLIGLLRKIRIHQVNRRYY